MSHAVITYVAALTVITYVATLTREAPEAMAPGPSSTPPPAVLFCRDLPLWKKQSLEGIQNLEENWSELPVGHGW